MCKIAVVVACVVSILGSGRRVHIPQAIETIEPETDALAALLLALHPSVVRPSAPGANLLNAPSALSSQPRCCTASISMGLNKGDKLPASVLKTCGISGKKAVVFFYGADDAPSCSKEIAAFSAAAPEFKGAGVTVVGVRNGKGVKAGTDAGVKLVVDDSDAMRNEIGIKKDLFGALGGRETYIVDGSGTIVSVHNNQFDPESHVKVAKGALEQFPKSQSPFEGLFR